jgi:gluconate 2-dehydrogenase gamma chain
MTGIDDGARAADQSDPEAEPGGLSRRGFLGRGGVVLAGTAGIGALAACGSATTKTVVNTVTATDEVTASAPATTAAVGAAAPSTAAAATGALEKMDARALQALTTGQATTLNAVLDRLIPTDASGPGASEAMVWRYIDGALAGDLSGLLPLYATGLRTLDDTAVAAGKARFSDLDATKQDSILTAMSGGKGAGGAAGAAFFATVHEHALQGMFGDPFHGGNAGFVGWDLLGYPGIKESWSAEEQAVGTVVKPVRASTYQAGSFGLVGAGA